MGVINRIKRAIDNKYNNLSYNSRRKITRAIMLAVITATTALGIKSCNNKNEKNKLYLVSTENIDENALENENGEKINFRLKIDKDLIAVVETKKTDNNKKYKAILIDEKGQMQDGFLDGKYLNDDAIDCIDIDEEFLNSLEIDVVTSKSGCWIRKNTIIDKDTDQALLKENDSNVISTNICQNSIDNEYLWKEVVYLNDDLTKLEKGYMVNGYILNKDYDKLDGRSFFVDVENLKVRKTPNTKTNDNIITKLEKGTKVYIVPNVASITDNNIDWFYIVYADKDGITKSGYVAATIYDNGEAINYLVEEIETKTKEINEKSILKKVSSKKVNYVNMRKSPGLDSEIIIKVDDETVLYTTQSNISNEIKKDGHTWLKVSLATGEEGYIACEYLVDYETQSKEINSNGYDFSSEGKIDGVFGIDVNNTSNPTMIKKLLTNNLTYEDDFPKMNEQTKPQFLIMKLGATGYSKNKFLFVRTTQLLKDSMNSILNICDEEGIPYGLYYYSQSTTIDETDQEIDNICELLKLINYNNRENRKLPLYIDVEYAAGNARVYDSAQKNGKEYQSNIINYEMNQLRKKTNLDICLYTDKNTLDTTFSYNSLDDKNKENIWIVDPNETHSKYLNNNYNELLKNTVIRQTELDKNVIINGIDYGSYIDYNIIDKKYLKKMKSQ